MYDTIKKTQCQQKDLRKIFVKSSDKLIVFWYNNCMAYHIDTGLIKEKFKEILNLHKSYKQTYELTFKELKVDQYLIELFSKPNFTLAYQYYKARKTNHKHINFSLIKRTNSYDNEDLSCSIVSAKAIRKAVYEKLDCNKYLPFEENIIDLTTAENILLNIINYKVQIDKTYSETINSEGIINYIFNNIKIDVDYKTTINNLCNKRYTISRIRRHLLYLLHISLIVSNLNKLSNKCSLPTYG